MSSGDDALVSMGYAFLRPDEGEWRPDPRTGLEQRDLGPAGVTDGRLGARELRVPVDRDPPAGEWVARELDFHLVIVTAGSVTLETEDGERHLLRELDAANLPALCGHRIAVSRDAVLIELTMPAESHGRTTTHQGARGRGPVITRESDESYVVGDGPRKFFSYRDLRTRESSGGRIHVQIIRAHAPGVPTGWHYHSMDQFAAILGGRASLEVEDHGVMELTRGCALSLGCGMCHNLDGTTRDYATLDVCIPADYETVQVADRSTLRR